MNTFDRTDEVVITQVREAINRPEVRETWQEMTKVDKMNVNTQERFVSIMGGTILLSYGLRRFLSTSGWRALAAGSYLLYRGFTGYCPAYRALGINTMSMVERQQFEAGEMLAGQESTPTEPSVLTDQPANTLEPDDAVDENLWQTFPASDPPATY